MTLEQFRYFVFGMFVCLALLISTTCFAEEIEINEIDVESWMDVDDGFEMFEYEPATTITFVDGKDEVTLSWDEGELVVEGDMHESAIILFEYLKPFVDEYIEAGCKD